MQLLLQIEFDVLPSWNDFLASHRHAGAAQGMVGKWRKKGFEKAIRAVRVAGGNITEWTTYEPSGKRGAMREVKHAKIEPVFINQPVFLVLRYWRPTQARYDNFNVFTKPVIDGFVEAGVIPDDNKTWIPQDATVFMGLDTSLKPSAEAKEARRIKRLSSKARQPLPARYWFEFYKFDNTVKIG